MVPGSFDALWSVCHKQNRSPVLPQVCSHWVHTHSVLAHNILALLISWGYVFPMELLSHRKSAAKVGWKQSKVLWQASKVFPFLVTELPIWRWTSRGQWSVGLQLAGSSTMGHFFCPAARLSNSMTICIVAARENKLNSCPIFVSEFLLF